MSESISVLPVQVSNYTPDASVISWSIHLERVELVALGEKRQTVLSLTLTRCDYKISVPD